MSLPSKPKPISKSSGTPLHFYVLPRDVAIRIFTLLPLSSLLTCQRINKRFRTLITRSEKFRPHLFLEPPAPATPKTNVSTSLHPVFGRLNFFAYHSAKAIRIGEGLNGIFLMKCPVREQFATSPALGEVVIRVISGGEWPFDAEIAVTNERGVTVWDVVRGVTGFFNEYGQTSFGDYFGPKICAQHKWDPKALMHNHEFLNPDLPFPTIYIPDRSCNKVFIADYAFNKFASMPLVRRPAKWLAEDRKEAKQASKAGNTPPRSDKKETEEGEAGDKPAKWGLESLEGAEEMNACAPNLASKRTAEVSDTLRERAESHSSRDTNSPGKVYDGLFPTKEAAMIPEPITPVGKTQEKLEDQLPLRTRTSGSIPLGTAAIGNILLDRKPDELQFTSPVVEDSLEEFTRAQAIEPTEIPLAVFDIPKEIPATIPAKLTFNSNINLNPRTPHTTSFQTPVSKASEPVGWEDAFD